MDWNLVISIISLVVGCGAIGAIFFAGQWRGTVEAELKGLGRQVDDLIEADEKKSGVLKKINTDEPAALRRDFDDKLSRVHARIDEVNKSESARATTLAEVHEKIQAVFAGIQNQRTEWETLRNDVRQLLRSEAISQTDISHLKERFQNLEARLNELVERMARAEASHPRRGSNA